MLAPDPITGEIQPSYLTPGYGYTVAPAVGSVGASFSFPPGVVMGQKPLLLTSLTVREEGGSAFSTMPGNVEYRIFVYPVGMTGGIGAPIDTGIFAVLPTNPAGAGSLPVAATSAPAPPYQTSFGDLVVIIASETAPGTMSPVGITATIEGL